MSGPPQLQALLALGSCQRCGRPVRVGPPPDPRARMLRRTDDATNGLCVNCAVRAWFSTALEVGAVQAFDPADLLFPHVQKQMAAILKASHADADPSEIDWAQVVKAWALPFPGVKPRRKARR